MNLPQSAQHAIVIGGSITGLLAARVLSDHFAQVTLIERDALHDRPEYRPGQPQTRHLHGLLASGKTVLERYFPDLIEELAEGGALLGDMGEAARWYVEGGYRLQYQSGMTGILMSRPFLEWQIRRRVLEIPNLTLLDGTTVKTLLATPDRSQITGVQIHRRAANQAELTPQMLTADLVLDASGRNSASPCWLAALGYAEPPETVVKVGLCYATRIYRRQPNDLVGAANLIISANPPHHQQAGIAFPMEGDRWIVTLAGWDGNQPPLDEQGFLAFAQSLPAPDIYNLISKAEPLSEITPYKFPASLRRHYEKLSRFPAGYLVMGDALCSFDPAYGQGMSSAALQAALLDKLLQQPDRRLLCRSFFKQAAKIIDIPWQLTVSEDFRFSGTQGQKPLGTDLINTYSTLVQRATHDDAIVYGAFLRVMNLMSSPGSLVHPRIVWRVLRSTLRAKISDLRQQQQDTQISCVLSKQLHSSGLKGLLSLLACGKATPIAKLPD